MTDKDRYLSKIAEVNEEIKADVSVGYFDDDIIMIDNVTLLSEPSATRMQMNTLAICERGRVQLELNGEPILLSANQVMICPPGAVFSNMMLSPDFTFRAVFLTNRILHAFLHEKMNIWTEMLYINRRHVVSIAAEDVEFLSLFYRMLNISISRDRESHYRTDVVQALLRAAVLGLCGAMEMMMKTEGEALSQPAGEGAESLPGDVAVGGSRHSSSQSIFQRFINLLNNSHRSHRTVQSYADELCITPKYLSAVCKKCSGKTANAWITEHQLEDIRYYLRQTDYSIKEICNTLGFPNASFFGKYVREHFGMTPSEFRKQ